jgi:hypothetical protein
LWDKVKSHGLHVEGENLFVMPVGNYMDSIQGLGCGQAGLRQSRGQLGAQPGKDFCIHDSQDGLLKYVGWKVLIFKCFHLTLVQYLIFF